MTAAAWTMLIALWHGQAYELAPQPVSNPLACLVEGQQIFAAWQKDHAGARLIRWGCTRRAERGA